MTPKAGHPSLRHVRVWLGRRHTARGNSLPLPLLSSSSPLSSPHSPSPPSYTHLALPSPLCLCSLLLQFVRRGVVTFDPSALPVHPSAGMLLRMAERQPHPFALLAQRRCFARPLLEHCSPHTPSVVNLVDAADAAAAHAKQVVVAGAATWQVGAGEGTTARGTEGLEPPRITNPFLVRSHPAEVGTGEPLPWRPGGLIVGVGVGLGLGANPFIKSARPQHNAADEIRRTVRGNKGIAFS